MALLAALAAGCGSSKGTVTGKVTYNGNPVPGGQVFFVLPDTPPVFAKIGPDGSYTAKDVPVGEATVCVETDSVKSAGGGAATPQYKPPKDADPNVYDPSIQSAPVGGKYVAIPSEYGDPATSTLRYTVKDGDQTHNIDLQ
jgi:hypothetical protein